MRRRPTGFGVDWGLRLGLLVALGGCSWTTTSPPGAQFLFGRDEPPAPASSVARAAERAVEAGANPGEAAWLRGGTGGDAPYEGAGTVGVVLAEGALGPRAVAGAWLVTPDGHRLLADEEGRFRVPSGSPLSGRWVVGARAHITSVVEGYDPEGTPTLHLEPFAREVAAPQVGRTRLTTLTGRVLDGAGQPLPGCVVIVGGEGVEAALPVLADAQGAFTMTPRLAAGGARAASLLAIGPGRLGLARLVLTGQDQTLEPVTAVAATHELEVEVAPLADLPAPTVSVTLRTEDGTALSLPQEAGRFRLAPLAGVRYDLAVEARVADGSAYSRLERPSLAIDWSESRSRLPASLLSPPVLGATTLTLGGTVRWGAVPGARGYTLSVAGPEASPGWPWEGFTTGTELAVALPGGTLQAGEYRLGVTAWDAPDVGVRALAAVPGLRALRRVDRTRGVRESHRSLTTSLGG